MNSMLSAIKARRGAPQGGMMESEQPEQQQAAPMQDLVSSLDPQQKQELMALLAEDQGQSMGDESGIEKGAMGMGEKKEIEAKAMSDAEGSELSADDSDSIAMSMTDRNASRRVDAGAKPIGLGDRAKMEMAKKLKGKGKM